MSDASSPKPHPFDVETVKFLVGLMSEHDLHEIDLREGDQRIRLLRGGPVPAPVAVHVPAAGIPAAVAAAPAAATAPAAAEAAPKPAGRATIDIKSESVGTFYVAAEPGAAPYVTVGSRVTPTTVIGQIEAMKLFTQIPAGVSGVITEVLVKNEQFVDYNQVLFRVDPNA